MFVYLVLISVPGQFRGEIAALEPAGERPGVVMDDPVLLQFGDVDEALPTHVTNMTCEILSSMLGHQVLLKSEKYVVRIVTYNNKVTSIPPIPPLDDLFTL